MFTHVFSIQAFWFSHTNTMSVIPRGASRRTSSASLLLHVELNSKVAVFRTGYIPF